MNIFISLYSGVNDPNSTNGAIPCFYETIIKDLEKSGHNLFVFVSKQYIANYKSVPRKLLNDVKEFKPDLFILFNNTFYDISKYFDAPIVIYDVDSPLLYSNQNALKSNISRYKFITSQEESITLLEQMYGANKKDILKVPFFTEIQAENMPIKHNISFISSKFITKYPNVYNKFMAQNPSAEEIQQFKALITEFLQDTFITKDKLLAKLHIQSEKIINTLDLALLIDSLSDYNRLETLDCVADLGLHIYGDRNWFAANYNKPDLMLNYINTPVYSLKDNQNIYNSSKIGININHLQARSGFSWRVCDILASNACLVTEYKPNIKKYFAEANVPTFTNRYEAREICQKLLKNENMRLDIVAASQEIINSKFRYKYVKKDIENFLGLSLSNSNKPSQTKYKVEYFRKSVLQQIFAITNSSDKKYKIIKICGAEIRIKKGK